MSNEDTKVFVGMSGGVDSSVSAALLKRVGYDVTGVFINVWQPDFIDCSQEEDRQDAMRAAIHLDMPFIVLDAREEYKSRVVDYMIEEYKAGRTPNPDIMCNKWVKFGLFYDKARAAGADFVATGHYVRSKDGMLLQGLDQNKDQSYFLWTITKEHLKHTLFPVGEFEKSHTRELAREFGLPNAEKKDSQGLCLMGNLDTRAFLANYIEECEGDVVNESGDVIGKHEGAAFFTLGQRHGFTITNQTPESKPMYVIAKDVDSNTITVSENPVTSKQEHLHINAAATNWITRTPTVGEQLGARIRYRQKLFTVTVTESTAKTISVTLEEPQATIPKGQSLVLYDQEVCLGGGIIA